MSDSQVLDFVRSEMQAGTSQQQIASKLLQRGATPEQIQRLRRQYDGQLQRRGMAGAADAAVGTVTSRMRRNNGEGSTAHLKTTGRVGSDGEIYADALDKMTEAETEADERVETQAAVKDATGKQVFGRDVFRSPSLTFEPNMNLATSRDYVLGPGDVLLVDIYGASQKTLELQVSPEGTVTVPEYGPVSVIGLTVAAAQSRLKASLGARYESSDLLVTVGQTRTIMVNVMGEVATPGTYRLSAFATVFHALYMAGGVGPLGTLRDIRVYRNGKAVTSVDVYTYILEGRLAGNVILQDDDVIVVGPYSALVGVSGSVKRPMFYEMKRGETVETLIGYAGGFTGEAYRKSVRVLRHTGEFYEVFNVEQDEQKAFALEDGDNVAVDGMLNRYDDMVEVRGAVFRPGQFRLGNDVKTVRGLIKAADGVMEDAFLARAVLHRLKEDRTLELISVDLAGILRGTAKDIELKNEDVLFIPTILDRTLDRTLTITGEVVRPGTYEYAEHTTVEDLIVEAGGLRDEASTVRVDVSRRIIDPTATEKSSKISKSYTLALKDGLIVDGDAGFELEPYDVVHVRRSPGFHTPRSITVEGEVQFEGAFTLETKNQRLSDAIRAAGGVTDDAYLKGATLLRRLNAEERRQAIASRRSLMMADSTLKATDLSIEDVFPVGIDLVAALAHPGSDADLVLREGDRLIIPEFSGTVKISGEVMRMNTVSYSSKKHYRWYVRQAGGFSSEARKRGTYIIYPNGTVHDAKRWTKIEPGCEIIVSQRPKREHMNMGAWLSVATSLSTIAVMVATIAK